MQSTLLLVLGFAVAPPAAAPTPRPTPTPPPPVVVLQGVVKGPDNRPVDKALVSAEPTARGTFPFVGNAPRTVSTRTDTRGTFRLELKRRGPHTVRVEAAGLAPATLDRVAPGPNLAVTLVKGGAIDGVVRDGNSGAPVAKVVVEAREERRSVDRGWDPDAGVVRAQTDAQGRFRIEGLAIGMHTVSTRLRGYDSARRSGVRTGGRVELYLFPGSALVGTVRDVQGAPVPKAVVRADNDLMPFRFGNVGYGLVATDERGRFEIPGLRPGRYKVTVRAPDFAVGTSDDVMVEADADAEAEVVLYRGAPITGRLVGPNEKPVAGRVTIHDDEAALPSPMGPDEMLSAETDAEGRFRVERVAPGSHVVAVVAPGFAPQRLTADVGTAGTPVDLGDVVLETGLQIRGRVRDKAGSPIADAQINGFNRRGFGGGNMLQARGEADGTFVIAGVQPGTYRLTARAYGYGEVSKSAEAGGDVVEFVMDAAGSVTGTAVDEAGRPVDAFRVTARPVVEETGMRFPPRFELIADAEGHFILDNLAPATYVLQVSAPDRADGVVSSVKIAPGATVDVGRLRLGAGGIVRGTVVDGGGTPVVGATVTARAGQSFGPQPANEAVSDGGGAFEIKGLPTGAVTVSGRHPNYADGRVTGVDVDPARGPSEVRLVLAQGGRVQGSVRRRDGAGVPNVLIQVSPMQRDGGFSFPGDNIQTTGADGTFSVDRLPAGRAKVMMLVGGAGQFQTGPSRDVEIVDGETAVADFVSQEILVSGHVMRGGAPAAGMRVNVRGEHQFGMFLSINASPVPAAPTGPQRGTATTREDGSFELLVDEPGTYHASASSADGRVSYPERQVSIPDADSFTLDLTYSGVPVAGVVVDRDTEQPVADANVFASAKDAERREATSAGGNTGADGRFFLELEPGEYTLNVRAESYAVESSELTVGSGGSSEVRLTLSRGGAIAGRLLDPNGRPAGGIYVGIRGDEDGTPRWSPGAQSLPDGSFQIANLAKGTYTLSAQSGSGMFALQTGVRPGQKDVTLTLQPGGRVQLLVRGPDGAPLEGAWASTSAVDGVKAGMGGGLQTNAQGMTDLAAPAGQVELSVRKDRLTGQTTVTVTPGGSVAAEVTLAEKPAGSSP